MSKTNRASGPTARKRPRPVWRDEVVHATRIAVDDARLLELAEHLGKVELPADPEFRLEVNRFTARCRASSEKLKLSPTRAETNAALRLIKRDALDINRNIAVLPPELDTTLSAVISDYPASGVLEFVGLCRDCADIAGIRAAFAAKSAIAEERAQASMLERLSDRFELLADRLAGLCVTGQVAVEAELLGLDEECADQCSGHVSLSIQQCLYRLIAAIDATISRFGRSGPVREVLLRRQVIEAARIYERFSDSPISHFTSQHRLHTGNPESRFGKFVVCALGPESPPRGLNQELLIVVRELRAASTQA